MKIAFNFLVALLTAFCGFSQDVRIISERGEKNEILIYAENPAEFEQSVKLDVTLKGMEPSEDLPIIKVVPPETTVYFLTIIPEPNKSYSYKYEYIYIAGDVTGSHDDGHVYHLPFPQGEEYMVGQGYNERPTHMDQFAVDFNMEEGTQVTAVRDGVVTRVVDKYNKGCPREECSQYNNFVLVKHADGSVADYSHIKRKGALVKIGDKVKVGDPVALSGSTGWASGPHLHFEIYLMTFSGQNSVKAEYYLNENTVGIPKSGQRYRQEKLP